MIEALKTRITELTVAVKEAERSADATARRDLLEDLERHIEELEARGGEVPQAARDLLRPGEDPGDDDPFENMPI